MSSGAGVFLASLVVMLLSWLISTEGLNDWGWRVGYIVGLILAIAALMMRLSIPESAAFEKLKEDGNISETPVRSMFKKQRKPLFYAIALSAYGNIAYYLVLSYLEVHFVELGYSQFFALSVVTVFSLLFAFSAPLWGALSDLVGRKPLIKVAIFIYIFFSYPAFMLMNMGEYYLFLSVAILSVPLILMELPHQNFLKQSIVIVVML